MGNAFAVLGSFGQKKEFSGISCQLATASLPSVDFQSDEPGEGRPEVTDNRPLFTKHFYLVLKERGISGCLCVVVTRRVLRKE